MHPVSQSDLHSRKSRSELHLTFIFRAFITTDAPLASEVLVLHRTKFCHLIAGVSYLNIYIFIMGVWVVLHLKSCIFSLSIDCITQETKAVNHHNKKILRGCNESCVEQFGFLSTITLWHVGQVFLPLLCKSHLDKMSGVCVAEEEVWMHLFPFSVWGGMGAEGRRSYMQHFRV